MELGRIGKWLVVELTCLVLLELWQGWRPWPRWRQTTSSSSRWSSSTCSPPPGTSPSSSVMPSLPFQPLWRNLRFQGNQPFWAVFDTWHFFDTRPNPILKIIEDHKVPTISGLPIAFQENPIFQITWNIPRNAWNIWHTLPKRRWGTWKYPIGYFNTPTRPEPACHQIFFKSWPDIPLVEKIQICFGPKATNCFAAFEM